MPKRFNRVFLISANYPNAFYRPGDTPEIGMAYIAEALESSNIKYDVIDMGLGHTLDEAREKASKFKPDLIGVGFKTFQHKNSYKIIEELKKEFPKAKTIAGGAHISVLRAKAFEELPELDFGIVGEGEKAMVELCKGKPLQKISGLIYRGKGDIRMNPAQRIKDLDGLAFPKYRKFELDKYWYPVRYISTSRGCPFNCVFCSVGLILGKSWIARSPESVIEEIRYWYKRGQRSFAFVDDNFTLLRERAMKILDLIKENNFTGIKLNCPNGIRADRVDEELLLKMRETGFDTVSFGVEVGSNRMLRRIKKGETIEQIEKAIALSASMDFNIHLFFIIGFPGQTEKDIEDAFKLSQKYPIRLANFNNLIPYPGTEVFEECKKKNYLLSPPEEYLNRVGTKAGITVLQTKELSEKKMNALLEKGRKLQKAIHNRHRYMRLRKTNILIRAMPFTIFCIIANLRDKLKNFQIP